VILAGLAAQNEGEFKVVGKPFTKEPYGIGLGLDDTGFRTYINSVLTKSYKDGSYKKAWEDTAGKMLPYVAPPAVDNY
jgi:glutamate transport system substrate-binding protein